MNIRELAEKYEPYVIEQRRYFHQYPELPWEEVETTRAIAERLREMGLEPHLYEKTGLYTEIRGGKAGPGSKTILLRADIDALPILEKTGAPYTSRKDGIMHACGHDAHTAMLLGAAKILLDIQPELEGTVRLLFQAAEETARGAPYYIEQGILDGVGFVYGSHVMGDMDAPYINIEAGPRLASADKFKIDVYGVSSHGSSPHTAKDALVAAASIVMNLQTVVARNTDPLEALAVSIGSIHGGNRFNILTGHVEMEGTVRAHSREVRAGIEETMRRIIENTAAGLGCTAELTYDYMVHPVINDPAYTELVREAAIGLYGEELLAERNKTMGSEDFADFSEKVPGVYVFFGSANKEKGITTYNHNDGFDIDESVMKRGAALYAQVAKTYLEKKD